MQHYNYPDQNGYFGPYGGAFVAETLVQPLQNLERLYEVCCQDPQFWAEYHAVLQSFVGRPTPIYFAQRWSEHLGGAEIYLKREDLNHTGAHKINNAVGQILLAKKMGKRRIIAETGAGQHGVAVATVCAKYGLECVVFMGAVDAKRQQANVSRMQLLGAKIQQVSSGGQTLKDALSEAIRDWVARVKDTFYVIGTVAGPHPYPMLVRDFQAIIGHECQQQWPKIWPEGDPDYLVACLGGGSNAMGLFYPYLERSVCLVGVEAAGLGLETSCHAASLYGGSSGVLHGNRTYLLQDAKGSILDTHSISAGLDYPGIGPEHAWLRDCGRVQYEAATDVEALDAFKDLCQYEGIIPALESSHALAYAKRLAPSLSNQQAILVNLSGRGDKDLETVLHLKI